MKKLLNGIFRPGTQQSTPRKPDSSVGSASATPNTSTFASTSSTGSSNNYGKRTQSPPLSATAAPLSASATEPAGARHNAVPRSSWDSFFASASIPRAPATPPLPVIQTPEKVFNQNLDILVREAVAKIKVVISKMIANDDFQHDLAQLSGFVTLAADKLQQNGEPATVVLRNYFASPAGTQLCEQTAFPSLVLDFLDKVRAFLLREELRRMAAESDCATDPHGSVAVTATPNELLASCEMARSIEFLMGCVQAIASNTALMEIYRCEIPNLIQLSAEEYPPSALFLRDLSTQALAAVSDKNFNAGLVWYLHDCSIVAKTVKLIAKHAAATATTSGTAAAALQALLSAHSSSSVVDDASGSANLAATAAAVSDALGLNKLSATGPLSAGTRGDSGDSDLEASDENDAAAPDSSSVVSVSDTDGPFCLESYDPLVGVKSLVYILQKTCRHSLVLLGEFQSSGGYALLTRLLRTCSEMHISTLIYLFTLLLPLGTGFSGAYAGSDDESMATIITCGARNVGAFLAMRDLLLKSISELEILGKGGELSDAMKTRDEQLILQLLTTILHVYTSDYDNFLSLEPKTQTLALMLTKLPWITFYDARVIVLRIVEYVCAAAKPESALPMELLSILCSLFIECATSETAHLLAVPRDFDDSGAALGSGQDTVLEPTSAESAMVVTENSDAMAHSGSESTAHSLALLLCSCIIKILQNSSLTAYRDALNSFGLLERGIYAFFVKAANALAALDSSANPSATRAYLSRINLHLSMWSTVASLMLRNNWQLCVEFRELQVHQSLYAIADALLSADLLEQLPRLQEFRGCVSALSVFSVFIELATFKTSSGISAVEPDSKENEQLTAWRDELSLLQSGVESDLSRLLESLQTRRGSVVRQCLLLGVLKQVLQGRDFVWGPWRSCQGHEILIALLSSVTGLRDDTNNANSGDCDSSNKQFVMMDAVLEILCEILDPVSGDESNRQYFKTEVGYASIAMCLANSGVLATESLSSVLNRVFELITGTAPPRNKIRNADAVHTLFCLLPRLETEVAVAALSRLLLKLTSNDEHSFSRKKQVAMLVRAGAFRWLADATVVRLFVEDTPLRAPLTTLILVLSREELATSQLREFLRVVAKAMPRLLGNQCHPSVAPTVSALPSGSDASETEEVGLFLLEQAFKGSRVPQVAVGTQVKTRMASGYVHVVNSTDRLWPPSSGYSFACWVRFPADTASSARDTKPLLLSPNQKPSELDLSAAVAASAAAVVEGASVSVALCEGLITITLDGDDADIGECYCVLVGPTLTFFPDSDLAIRNEHAIKTLDVTAVACSGELEFYFWSHEKRFLAKCRGADDVAMWLKAMQQSESISNVTVRNRNALADALTPDDELLFVSDKAANTPASESESTLDGYVCLLSVYSIESAGCYVRIYFEQATGCLRVDTGSVSSGPNMNPNPKRNTATFKNIDMKLLRAAQTSSSSSPSPFEKSGDRSEWDDEDGSHWHHLTFTHRKAVVGSSLLTLYIDGSEVTSKKLSYPSAPTTGAMQAFVGKDIQVCGTFPALPWSIGPAWLTEEVLSANGVICMFLLGPSFSGQFSGHAYRAAGDWPEAHASAQLDRATQRRVDSARIAKRLQLAKLGRASRRQWSEAGGFGVNALVAAASDLSSIAESAVAASSRREDASDGFRFSTGVAGAGSARKEQQRVEAFQSFIQDECAMSAFGNEILQLLSSFKVADDLVLFSLNTNGSAEMKTQAVQHTQIQYVGTERSSPLDLPKVLPSVGGVTQMLLPLLENAWRSIELRILLDLLGHTLRQNPSCMAECLDMNAYALIASMLTDRIQLVDDKVLQAAVRLAISVDHSTSRRRAASTESAAGALPVSPCLDYARLSLIVDATALSQVVLSSELRRLLPWRLQCQLVLSLLDTLEPVNPNALFNVRQLRRAGLLSWLLLYISELCNEDCALEQAAALEHRWCFPDFAFAGYNELLQRLLALLRAYLRVENHVDDVFAIADMLLLSLTTESVHRRDGPFRVVLLQFLLHEIESDAGAQKGPSSPSSSSSASASTGGTSALDASDLIAPTVVDAVLYRAFASSALAKKRKDKSTDAAGSISGGGGGSSGVLSPTAGAASALPASSLVVVDGVETILLEIIRRTDSGPFASIEALLALRVLLSLAQESAVFAQFVFQSSPAQLQKIKRALQSYSADGNTYIPLLAYVSNVAIKDTKYSDSVASPSARLQQYVLPTTASAFASPDRFCVDQVWELLGSLLLRNCELPSEQGRVITVTVLSQLAAQAEVSESFFTAVCASSSTVFRIVVQCLMSQAQQMSGTSSALISGSAPTTREVCSSSDESPESSRAAASDTVPLTLQLFFSFLILGRPPESFACALAAACFDLLRVIANRSLFERDEFAALMMYLLECLDDGVLRQKPVAAAAALADAQKCWLALLVHVVKSTQALSDNCSLLVLRNLCALAVALAKYLVDENKHQGVANGSERSSEDALHATSSHSTSSGRTESHSSSSSLPSPSPSSSCFGTDVLVFLLSSIRMCSEPHITHTVGVEEQQFVYGCLVYCAQTVLLSELNGLHRGVAPPQRLLDCLVSSKHLLLQQTKCSSVIVCGTFGNHPAMTTADASAGSGAGSSSAAAPGQGGFSGRLHRMRSLSANAHKEFGIGSESDRSFILSLAAELFRMLVDDSENVRHSAILTWQFLLQQRMGVLKELLIVEPRVSLLQNITTNKKEAIDVFHGGFERLLHVLPQRLESGSGFQLGVSRDGGASIETPSDDAASNSRESWLQFHIWLTENFDLLKDLILVRTEPIYQHLVEVLLSCLCVRKASSTSSAMRLMTQADVALTVDFLVYFDAEYGGRSIGAAGAAASSDEADAAAFRTAARKTLFKLSNWRESSLDAMADAQARWRETLLQLLHTRSVWQMEGWCTGSANDKRLQSGMPTVSAVLTDAVTPITGSEPRPFYLERSIFQQSAFKYRLDYTEGPQRMRLRLVRSYESWGSDAADAVAELNDDSESKRANFVVAAGSSISSDPLLARADEHHSPESSGDAADLFKHSREFHEAVEVFREFHFKLTAHPLHSAQSSGTAAVLADIVSRATFERTREAFTTAAEDIGHDSSVSFDLAVVARRLFRLYIATAASSASTEPSLISEATVAEIERLVSAAEANPLESVVPSTVFDIADSELMQATIPTILTSAPLESVVRAFSPSTAAQTTAAAVLDSEDDDDEDDGVSATISPGGNKLDAVDGADDSDEDAVYRCSGDGARVESKAVTNTATRSRSALPDSRKCVSKTECDPGSGSEQEISELSPLASEKLDSDIDSTIFDSSYDYIYGGVARFLQRDDYAPLRCYNAVYIAGMDKIDGIFAVCRHALYFIGGYEKLFYSAGESDVGGAGGNSGSSAKSSLSNPLSPSSSSSYVSGGAAATGMMSPQSGSGSSNLLSPGRASLFDRQTGGAGSGAAPGKKKAKNLIRNTLADLSNQFSHSKNATSQLFTVVPLLALSDQGTAASASTRPSTTNTTAQRGTASRRWSIRYVNVKQFSRIKYQLRPVGIEFFDTFGSTFFLQFESQNEREDVIKLMFQMPIVNSIFWNPLLRSSALSLSVKRIRQALTKRWLRGAISNFEYLMHLNTLAGRSFNDITQYPVFPWIVADYSSDFLDLDDRAMFRDLSKPMGALGATRAAQFRERYAAMSDVGPCPGLDAPAFHYGTHYSCSAYVVNYLIRLEPFTQLALELQGGSFDHADRLFCNIPSSWKSASTDNLQDVRELIPEFFYLPEFLYNANGYDFGTTQSGDVVSHVRLPPWAHSDPREFVRLHRRALESKYVSENLHQWIDLIFGVKQTGAAALEAQNVFMHVTYEGTVDIDQIADPVMRTAMLSQIENFGQTPSRIFSSPHPQRRVPTLLPPAALSSLASSSTVGHQYEGNTLSSIEAYVKWHTPLAPALVAIGKDYVFLKKVLALKVLDEAIGDVKLASSDKFQCRGATCSFVPPRFTKYADWGSARDGTIKFRVHQSSARYREANKVIGVIEGAHYCRVHCATFSDDGHIFVTGGQDGVVNALECLKVNGQRIFKQFAKLVGHEDAIESVAINKEFNLIASGSADCCAILWDLRTRAFLRELVGHSAPVTQVAINSANANVLTATATEMRVWSVNGDLLAATSTPSCGLSAITSTISTRCDAWQHGVVAVTGHSNGTIALWGLSYPSDIERERRAHCKAEPQQASAAAPSSSSQSQSSSVSPMSPLSSLSSAAGSRAGGVRPAVRIGVEQSSRVAGIGGDDARSSHIVKAVPTCQLFIMKLLLDHRAGVTALTLGADQRQLLSGDAEGNCIRWVDDSISTNIL